MDWEAAEPPRTPSKRGTDEFQSSPLSSLSPSPRKKTRLDGESSQPSQTSSPTSPLNDLKVTSSPDHLVSLPEPLLLHVLLFHLAQDSLEQAAELLPRVGRGAKKEGQLPSQTWLQAVSEYRRLIAFAITSLRSVVNLAEGTASVKMVVKPEVELSSRCVLAELLMREIEEGAEEAEQVLARGIVTAQKHDSLGDFKYRLYALQVELILASGDEKMARTAIRRRIEELSTGLPDVANLTHWLYHFHLLNVNLTPVPSSSALRDLVEMAKANGGDSVIWASELLVAHSALVHGNQAEAKRVIGLLSGKLGLQMDPQIAAEPMMQDPALVRPFVLQACVLYGFYHAHYTGNMELAKSAVTLLSDELEKPSEPEDEATYVTVDGGVHLTRLPRAHFYTASWLFSCLVNRDMAPKKHQALAYHDALLGLVRERWVEPGQNISFYGGVNGIERDKHALVLLEVYGLLSKLEVQICRSRFEDAIATLKGILALVVTHGLHKDYDARVLTAAGMLRQAIGSTEEAVLCYRAAIKSADENSLWKLLAQASLLLTRVGEGVPVRRFGHQNRRRSSPKKDGVAIEETHPDIYKLGAMATELLGRCAKLDLPSFQFISDVISAVAAPTDSCSPVGPKRMLSSAVSYASRDVALKALVLALLATQYSSTFDVQTGQMLVAAAKLTRSLGAEKAPKGVELADVHVVGKASTGLWIGEQLLRYHQRDQDQAKIDSQTAFNEAHRRMLTKRDALVSAVP